MPTTKSARKRPIGFYIASTWLGLMVFLAVFGPFLPLPTWNEAQFEFLGAGPFSAPGHLLGTTNDGYDMLSGLVNGARISIFVSVVSVTIGGLIGGVIGISSAYYRGKFDSVVQMVFNIMLSIPNLVLSLALISSFAADTDEQTATVARRMTVLIFSLTIVIVPIVGRIARGSALQWSNREFVLASKSMGTPNLVIIRKHILPNVAPAMLAIAFLAVGSVIIVEGSLALLGVGIPGGASWGSMLATGRNYLEFSPHEVYMPALAIAFTVISTNYFGDYVRNHLDKRESKI
ncbi:MAG: ABC transporter permease subunit [Actinobacteria bacterium]|nr:ABC transporter permease subunit [Actinomycetota bacterium]MTB12794.1 ABC transporter permease subunit [Actinomycetota bacterium]